MYSITRTDGGFGFAVTVPADERFEGVAITGIHMYVAEDEDDGCGDLAVMWDTEGLENTGGGDMGSLLLRGDDDAVGAVMGEFYWNGGYNLRLQELLAAAGVPMSVATAVGTSEWGMQDEGRASYDAYELGDWVREQAMAVGDWVREQAMAKA